MQQQKEDKAQPNKPEVFVVCYQTKDIKTNEYNPPKAFECEVRTIRVDKKNTQQKIVITKTLNFDKEME
jgi:hypothetical protein